MKSITGRGSINAVEDISVVQNIAVLVTQNRHYAKKILKLYTATVINVII